MKKITRIEDVYTVPKTEAEWILTKTSSEFSAQKGCLFNELDNRVISVSLNLLTNKTEVPIDQFLDLLNDKITPWRLLEVGFERIDDEQFQLNTGDGNFISCLWPSLDIVIQNKYAMIPLNITTFAELLQMMKFRGWKNERE